jgi:ATP-binding cassette subfamily F protein 3
VKSGHNVKIGYFAQNQASLLNENLSVFDTIDQIAVGDIRTKVRDILGAFMFGGDDIEKKVKVLSGGERSRLAMIRLLLEPYNFLVMDEPTNHLDIHSREILKEALIAFEGTLLVVSHDREFLSGLVDVVYEFRHKKIRQHLGGINDFLEKKRIATMREFESSAPVKREKKEVGEKKDVGYEERKEINKMISKAERQVDDYEKSISVFEDELLELDKKLSEPSSIEDGSLFSKYEEVKKSLEDKMQQWEKQNEDLDNLKALKTW